MEEAISRLSRGESNFLYSVYYARAEVKCYNGLIAVFQLLGGREKSKEISGSLIGSVKSGGRKKKGFFVLPVDRVWERRREINDSGVYLHSKEASKRNRREVSRNGGEASGRRGREKAEDRVEQRGR